jgi:hypothetical protein
MQIATLLKCRWMRLASLGIAVTLSPSFSTQLHAQKGNNAVCTGSGTVPSWAACSASILDATQFSGADVCAKIASAISAAPAVGAVIDARGVSPGTCASVPWNGTGSTPNPAVILLPAGTITIPSTWVLPNYTRVFGQGQRGSPSASGTVIQGASTFSTGTPMIEFGYISSGSCASSPLFGISVQDVMLEGPSTGQSVVGILNQCAEELSFVSRVNFYQINGTSLEITSIHAQNSGPYSDLTCSPGSGYSSGTVCVDINGVGDTRGIHGLTATAPSGTSSGPLAAVLLDSNNNTIEDAHFEGFQNGILVGANASANSNALFNITGGTGAGPMNNVVEISNAHTVTDLSIMAVSSGGATNSIEDQEYGSTALSIPDAYVGLYAIGAQISASVYSRFNTSPKAPGWLSGAVTVSGSCTPVANGTLYSNSSGGNGSSLYVCAGGTWYNLH